MPARALTLRMIGGVLIALAVVLLVLVKDQSPVAIPLPSAISVAMAQAPAAPGAKAPAPTGAKAPAPTAAATPAPTGTAAPTPATVAPTEPAPEAAPAGEPSGEAAGTEEAATEEVPEEEAPSPWTFGLMISICALTLGGVSAVLGIWVDRDKSRPAIFASTMSVLIVLACTVGGVQGYLDSCEAIQRNADLERMLDMVDEIARSSNDPTLMKLLEDEGAVPPGSTAAVEADKAAADAEAAALSPEDAEPADGTAPAEGAPPTTDAAAPAAK